MLNEQQQFWANEYAQEYIEKNKSFDQELGKKGWSIMLKEASHVNSILECGCNIGRNLQFINDILPQVKISIIEISKTDFDFVNGHYKVDQKFNGSILQSNFKPNSFDLTFTMGVLIHIHPNDVLNNMQKLYDYSSRYVLIGEYFNRTKVMLEYQGQPNKLFKMDFGKLFIENFNVNLVDYGFLWGHLYDSAGFDDVTWWLFEKR